MAGRECAGETCSDPAVLAGFWLQDDPTAARQVLTARAAAGANTLLLPRLPNLNYAQHANAPAAVEVRHKSFKEVHLEKRTVPMRSPARAMIQSPLAHGKVGHLRVVARASCSLAELQKTSAGSSSARLPFAAAPLV